MKKIGRFYCERHKEKNDELSYSTKQIYFVERIKNKKNIIAKTQRTNKNNPISTTIRFIYYHEKILV